MAVLYDKSPIKCTYKDDIITVKIFNKTLRFWCICKELPEVIAFSNPLFIEFYILVGTLKIDKIAITHWTHEEKINIISLTLWRDGVKKSRRPKAMKVGNTAVPLRYDYIWKNRCLRRELHLFESVSGGLIQ